mgnify:CR=1 FL=1
MRKKKYNISLNQPFLNGNEKKYLMDCINSNWVSTVGPYVKKFEYSFSNFLGSSYAVACSSGTAALHLALLAIGVKKNDLVIVPNLTFIATANVIKYIGAEPILIDINYNNAHLDLELLEKFLLEECYINKTSCIHIATEKNIKAIIPVHILGHAIDMIKLKKIVKKYFIKIIEDAAEAIGVKFKNKYIGFHGDISCFSFNGNKTITSGSGGMIATNSKSLAKKVRHLSTQAKTHKTEFLHDEIGYNYRMSNIHSAIGLAQLEKLNLYLDKKKKIANRYIKAFKKIEDLTWISPIEEIDSSWWLFTIIIKNKNISADRILEELNINGIQARKLWKPLNMLKPYKKAIFVGKNTSFNLYKNSISIPSSANLKKDEQDFVIDLISKLLKIK